MEPIFDTIPLESTSLPKNTRASAPGKAWQPGPTLETTRLRLRRWESRDVLPVLALSQDPVVMRFFNGLLSPAQCLDEIERQEVCFDAYGYGMWAVELKKTGEFIGTIGLEPTMMAPKGMTARMTWKLRRDYWGQNYAYEAGREVLEYAFHHLGVREAFAVVDTANTRSLRLMERLGLKNRDKHLDCFYKSLC